MVVSWVVRGQVNHDLHQVDDQSIIVMGVHFFMFQIFSWGRKTFITCLTLVFTIKFFLMVED